MIQDRQRQIERLYHAALELEETRRHEFLVESTRGDESLWREVETLLANGGPSPPQTDGSPYSGRLEIGSRRGPYEIIGNLGRGGMGEVYLARDTRLGRKVAIKISGPMSVRFEREARAISALNHPHICTLYDIGSDYLVMEFIDGQTLAQHLRRGPLPIEDVLKWGAQIADALSAAHAQGIIHRDLKPGNIMLTARGVKVLDFGLAKYASGAEENFDATATAQGGIVGTPAYMAPEQVECRECDPRTDIFALGLVLYEMASGKRAFDSSSPAEWISQVLHREVDSSELQPPQFAHLVERCLAKKPADRWHSAADIKLEIEWIEKNLNPARTPSVAAPPAAHRKKRVPLAALSALALLIVIGGLGWFWWAHREQTQPAEAIKLIPLTTYPGIEQQPSLSPDGSQVAFSWNGPDQKNFDIYVKTTGAGPPLRLTKDPADDINPVWSPDGSSIAFLRKMAAANRFEVLLMPALGGPERKLADVSIPDTSFFGPPYVAWLPDSKSLIITDRPSEDRPTALFLFSVLTGERRQLTFPPAGAMGDHCPAASPDGKALAFRRGNAAGQWGGSGYVVALDGSFRPNGEPQRLTPEQFFTWICVAWTADSQRLVIPHDLGLWTLAVSPGGGKLVSGEPRMAVETGQGATWPSVARTSARLAYAHRTGGDQSIWRMRIPSPHEKLEPPVRLIASTKGEFAQQYSPDGRKIAFESYRSGNLEIWVCSSEGEDCTQLTSMGSPETGTPGWSPDGRHIAFYSNLEGKAHIFVIPAEGGAAKTVTTASTSAILARWSRNGEWIYFSSKDSGASQIWRVPSGGGTAVQVTQGGGFASSESTDGKWLYFTRELASESSLWRKPVDGGEEVQVLPSIVYGNFTVVDDGIYYVTKAGQGFAIAFLNFATGKSETLSPIGDGYVGFSVSPDRKWILYTQTNPENSELVLVEGFR